MMVSKIVSYAASVVHNRCLCLRQRGAFESKQHYLPTYLNMFEEAFEDSTRVIILVVMMHTFKKTIAYSISIIYDCRHCRQPKGLVSAVMEWQNSQSLYGLRFVFLLVPSNTNKYKVFTYF